MKPKNNTWRFYIGRYMNTHTPNAGYFYREVFPSNSSTIKIISENETGRIFTRKKITGTPTLINNESVNDYTYLKSLEALDEAPNAFEFLFQIRKMISGQEVTKWTGTFNIAGCSFDDDACTAQIVTMNTKDEYQCLLKNTEKQYNLFDLTNTFTCIGKNTFYQIETAEEVSIKTTLGVFMSSCFEPAYQSNTVTMPLTYSGGTGYPATNWVIIKQKWELLSAVGSVFTITTTWGRLYVITLDEVDGTPIPPTSGTWVDAGPTTLQGWAAHKWINTDFAGQVYANTPQRENLNGCNNFQWTWTTASALTQQTYIRNRSFIEMIEQTIEACGLYLKSNFFTDATNYVTGQANKLTKLLVAGKTDIKDPTSTEPQTLGLYTFSEIETLLREAFNCYWEIDVDGYFRVEHYSYWNRTLGRNLKLLENGKYILKTNKYAYDTQSSYSKERWTFMESGTIDFKGNDISYENIYSNLEKNDSVQDHAVGPFTTDLGFVQYIPSSISNEGFILMACFENSDGILEVINEAGKASTLMMENGHLSAANLQDAYHRHNRLFPRGYLNNTLVTFESSKKIKKQIEIRFPICGTDELDETKLIRTNLGDGEIKEATFDLTTEMQSVVLIY